MHDWPLLSLLIWLPIVGGFALLALGASRARAARILGLLVAIATLALCVPLFLGFDRADGGMQFLERVPWVPAFGIDYHLGIDGISLVLILLTAITTVLTLIGAWSSVEDRVPVYYAAFLLLEGMMIGVFSALDAALFYVFFEGMLLPMFLIIGMWGGPRRVYASLKFFLYTFLGSVFMLVGLIYLYTQAGSFEIAKFAGLSLGRMEQTLLFFAFLIAFAIKVPMWPVHTWLPDAHVEAPTGGSVILAAIMLKIGGYGFLRFPLPITPDACMEWAWLVVLLSLVAVVYIGFVALAQEDMKKLIAYSSISHMGFVTLGIFLPFALLERGATDAARLAVHGAMVQMISHGFVSGALFSCVGVLYDRMHSRMIGDYGGVANVMPRFAALFVLFAMANAGLPGTSGFVGEFMVVLAAFQASPWIAAAAALTLILGAAYTLWLVKRVIFGAEANAEVASLKDLQSHELLTLFGFAFFVLLLGVWPAIAVDLMDASVVALLTRLGFGGN